MEVADRTAGRPRDPHADTAIVEAVLDLVDAGATLSGLSLVAIAAHAGVSRNSVYRRWKTKDALYLDVLASLNAPLPAPAGGTARNEVLAGLRLLVERTVNRRASSMLRALNAEATAFPELHRRYFDEIVAPRREAMYRALRQGIAAGEIRSDVDVELVNDVLVGMILSRMSSGAIDDLDPEDTGQRIVDIVFTGIQPR